MDGELMKILLLSSNENMCDSWRRYFQGVKDIEILCEDLTAFKNIYEYDCIATPANSYGLMDGGFDLAVTDVFGVGLMKRVQKYIIDNYHGEQPVATSFIIDINEKHKLIHTPTMRVPQKIKDPYVIYQCMRTTLLCALNNDVNRIIIPAFGGECGFVDYDLIARMMKAAYVQINSNRNQINWDLVDSWNNMLNEFTGVDKG